MQNQDLKSENFIEIKKNLSFEIFLDIPSLSKMISLSENSTITVYYYRVTDSDRIYFYQNDCKKEKYSVTNGLDCIDHFLLKDPENIVAISFMSESGFYGLEENDGNFFYSPQIIAEYPERLPGENNTDYYCAHFPKVYPNNNFSSSWYCEPINWINCPDGNRRYYCGINPHPIEYLNSLIGNSSKAWSIRNQKPEIFSYNYREYNGVYNTILKEDIYYFYIGIHLNAIHSSSRPSMRFSKESTIFRHLPDYVSKRFTFQIPDFDDPNESLPQRMIFSIDELFPFPNSEPLP